MVVAITFVVLMIIALAWLVFYYLQVGVIIPITEQGKLDLLV